MKFANLIIIVLCPIIASCSPSPSTLFKERDVRALAIAGANGDTNKIDKLLAKGVDINAVGKDNCTPLGWTLVEGNKVGFEYLLKKGADPNGPAGDGETILTRAIRMKDPFFLDAALSHGGNPNQKIKSTAVSTLPTMPNEFSLLNEALFITPPTPEIIKVLIKHGARPLDNEDPVKSCAMMNRYENCFLLLEAEFSFSTNREPNSLLERLENRGVHPDDPECVWRDRVVDFLSDRGIEVTPKKWKKEDQPKIINVITK